MSVSKKPELKECSISFDSGIRYTPQAKLNTLGALAEEVFNIRMFGSSARALSYVAEGKLDLALEFHDRIWDSAGSACIISEAGGKITDLEGGAFTLESVGYIASNGRIHDRVKDIIRKHSQP